MAQDIEISGVRDGVNRVFTNPEPYVPNSLHLWHNGQLQDDWFVELDPSLGTFETCDPPRPNDTLGTLYTSIADTDVAVVDTRLVATLDTMPSFSAVVGVEKLFAETSQPQLSCALQAFSLVAEFQAVIAFVAVVNGVCGMAQEKYFEFTPGEYRTIGVTVKDSEGAEQDLTGWSFRCSFRDAECEDGELVVELNTDPGGGIDIQPQIDPTLGQILITLDTTTTLLFSTGRYYFDVWGFDPSGNGSHLVKVSPVRVCPRVTIVT